MVHLIFAVLFIAGALIATAAAARDQLRTPQSTSPLTAVALLCAAVLSIMARQPPTFFYKGSIALALLVAMLAMALMAIKGTPQLVHVGTNVVVYLILWLGFLAASGRALWTLPGLIAFFAGFVALGALYFVVRSRLAWLSLSVLLYIVNAALVVGGAAALVAVHPALWSILALVGALLYVGSDSVRAWATWRGPVHRGGLHQALLVSLGGLLLAVSVWGDALLHLWPGA